jgi:hypothetical protein
MEEYTILLREHLKKNRKWSRTMFKVVGTIYRAVTKGRINYEQGLQSIEKLGGSV